MATDVESSVSIPVELHAQKVALDNGEKPRVTVRQLLRWFEAARRGYHVVQRIRAALEALGMITYPDFEGEYIDQEVFFMPKGWGETSTTTSTVNADTTTSTTTTSSTTTTTMPSDQIPPTAPPSSVGPSHRLGRLGAANQKPVSVSSNERLEVATTLMLTHNFSQLPVMQGCDIRNDVMHFDPDGITTKELDDLRRFSDFLERLQRVTK
jgi:CBS domain-containing protein